MTKTKKKAFIFLTIIFFTLGVWLLTLFSVNTFFEKLPQNYIQDLNTLKIILLSVIGIFGLFVLVFSYYILVKKGNETNKKELEMLQELSNGALDKPYNNEVKNTLSNILESIRIKFLGSLKYVFRTTQVLSTGNSKIEKIANEINNLTLEIDNFIEKTKASSKNTVASVQEVNAGSEEIATTATDIANSSEEIQRNSDDLYQKAVNGKEKVDNINKISKESVKQSKDTSGYVKELSDNIKDVANILESINSITEQTNLLALNAAIEAARAGEAGKGFAVVASEIRSLADESSKATENISSILQKINKSSKKANNSVNKTVTNIEDTFKYSNEVSGMFGEIIQDVDSVHEMIESLTAASEEQSATTEEMASSITNITNAIETIAHDLENIKAVSNKNKDLTKSLTQLIPELEDSKQNLIKLFDDYNISEKSFLEEQKKAAIEAHTKWVENLKKSIKKRDLLNVEGNHKKCKFGIFLQIVEKNLEDPKWNKINELHEELHNKAHSIKNNIKNNEIYKAESEYQNAEKISTELVSAINSL